MTARSVGAVMFTSMTMGEQAVSRWQNGRANITGSQLIHLCKILHVTPNDLLDWKQEIE